MKHNVILVLLSIKNLITIVTKVTQSYLAARSPIGQ